jgi:sulfotransferase family protein
MTGPPFFIVACDRSGTTMLRLILDRSPDVAIPTESMILVDFAGAAADALDTDAEFDGLAGAVWRHPKVREWALPGAPPARAGRTGPAAYRAAIEAPFLAYAELHGKPRWADKTPYYVGEIDHVKRVFPEARIVNLVRDGRDVALSLLRVPFGPSNVWAAARQWRAAVDAGDAAKARYGDEVLTVRYEDLVTEPDTVVRAVCAFCEIAYEPEMLAIDESAGGKLAAGQEGWFSELFAGIGTRSVGKWRTQMTGAQQAVFAAEASAALRRHGYEVPDAAAPPRVPAAAYAAHNWAVKLWNFARLHVWQERGREVPHIIRRRLRGRPGSARPRPRPRRP